MSRGLVLTRFPLRGFAFSYVQAERLAAELATAQQAIKGAEERAAVAAAAEEVARKAEAEATAAKAEAEATMRALAEEAKQAEADGAASVGERTAELEEQLETMRQQHERDIEAACTEAREAAYEETKKENASTAVQAAEVEELRAQLQAKLDEKQALEQDTAEKLAALQEQAKGDIVEQVKSIMSEVFMSLHQSFETKTSYTGKQVMSVVRKTMKKATEKALKPMGDADGEALPADE